MENKIVKINYSNYEKQVKEGIIAINKIMRKWANNQFNTNQQRKEKKMSGGLEAFNEYEIHAEDNQLYISISSEIKYYQTENAMESVCIIEDPDGSISIGFARAGRIDKELGRITSEDGLDIAKGRAEKARKLKTPLIERNYVRGIYLPKINKDI